MALFPETKDLSSIDPCLIYAFTEPNSGKSINAKRTAGFYGGLSGDQYGALYTTNFAAIKTHQVTLGNTAVPYSQGHCLGTIESCDSVNRGNAFGAVLETVNIAYTGDVAAASLPDLDLWILSRATDFTGSSFTNAGFPSISATDTPYIVGSVPIRVASGHWRQFKSSAGVVQRSIATVNPFLSFNTNNSSDSASDIGVLVVTQTAFTPAGASAFLVSLTIRKG